MAFRVVSCPCGSGEPSHWVYDAKGIAMFRSCPKCDKAKRARYRPEVFTDPGYSTEEPVDGD
jgi:hypothetical protein